MSSPHTSNSNAPSSERQEAQQRAARSLLSSLVNEKEIDDIKRHQASTLEELQDMKSSLTALNKSSAELFSKTAADYVRAARLAGQVKSDLNDITKRITSLKAKLAALQPTTDDSAVAP